MSGKVDIHTRDFAIDDYGAVLALWKKVEGLDIAEGDDRETVRRFLMRNPGMSRVANAGSTIVGAVLCGHDGRRGYIYHLAIDPAYQNLGIGRRLAAECREKLKEEGLERVNILVAHDNLRGREFWKYCGWEELEGAVAMGADV